MSTKASLQFVAGYVPNAFALPRTFDPENITFGVYTFVPWARSGLSAALTEPTGGNTRATVSASVMVRGDNDESETAARTLLLRGPSDVTGLDVSQVIRRIPQRDTIDAEANFLAHVEFDRPELPWLFSPRKPAGERVAPWITLVVCEESVTDIRPGAVGFPQQMKTRRGELQPLDDCWAWAHAQVLGEASAQPPVGDRLSASHGPANLSRLICPRRLDEGRRYIAAIVPTFDCGVRAAMNQTGGTLDWAWRAGDPGGEIILPVFDWWRFATAKGGDFEKLAGRLHGIRAPWAVGRRIIDTHLPLASGFELQPDAPGATQVLRCALFSPAPQPPDTVNEGAGWNAATRDVLRQKVDVANLPDDNLPRVGARLYARFQRGAHAVGPVFGAPATSTAAADNDWFSQLNTSPLHRIVAGLGTRVVQRDQEPLMQAAWSQVAGIRKANQTLVQMQFGRYVGEALHRNHFSKLNIGSLVQVMRGVQAKIRMPTGDLTVEGAMNRSRVAPAATGTAFRRITRVAGPMARFTTAATLRALVAPNGELRDFRRLYQEPDGVVKLSSGALEALPTDVIARVLAVEPAAARPALEAKLATWKGPVLSQTLARPVGNWKLPAGSIDLGARAAQLVDARVRAALPRNTQAAPARSEALAPLLVGLRNTRIESVAAPAERLVARVDEQLAYSLPRRPAGLPTHLGLTTSRSELVRRSSAPPLAGIVERPIARLRFENVSTRRFTDSVAVSREVAWSSLAGALSEAVLGIGVAQLPKSPERPALAVSRQTLLDAIEPASTVTAHARARFDRLKSVIADDWWDDGRLSPIMWAPRFDRSMFEALADYDRDWIIPGLGEIPETDFVTVLSTNPEFTETFLVGLSDEMGRELLWRGYPTDQRGTYFHRFWSRDTDDLGREIHRFGATPLGSHRPTNAPPASCVVLVIRGEVVRRYPDAVVLAMREGGKDEQGRPQFTSSPADTAEILFHHHLAPDIRLVGFNLSTERLRSERWWFLITENPTGPRFGLDIEEGTQAQDHVARNNLDWNDLGPLTGGRFLSAQARTLIVSDDKSTPKETTWAGNSAIVARTLLQNPVRAAFDAQKLITPA